MNDFFTDKFGDGVLDFVRYNEEESTDYNLSDDQ